MTQRYLLDTKIISDLLRNPQGKVTQQISKLGEENICTSIIVASELRFGAAKKGSQKLTDRVKAILSAIEVIPLEEPADSHYANIRNHLEKSGVPIGPNDLLISAQALALDLTVITANTEEFTRVPGLKVENWI
jgi:tRNA(fMet)-specific endonuclease VapC